MFFVSLIHFLSFSFFSFLFLVFCFFCYYFVFSSFNSFLVINFFSLLCFFSFCFFCVFAILAIFYFVFCFSFVYCLLIFRFCVFCALFIDFLLFLVCLFFYSYFSLWFVFVRVFLLSATDSMPHLRPYGTVAISAGYANKKTKKAKLNSLLLVLLVGGGCTPQAQANQYSSDTQQQRCLQSCLMPVQIYSAASGNSSAS